MNIWLWRALVVSAIGAYLYYKRTPPASEESSSTADETAQRAGTAAGG
jgi:hypothetical protein